MLPTKLDYKYIAGFFDGEGYIYLKHNRDKRHKNKLGYIIGLGITNTNFKVLQKIQQRFGGNIYKSNKGGNRKDVYELLVGRLKEIKNAIICIEKYVIVKKAILKLAKEYCISRLRYYHSPYTLKEIKITEKIRALNKRGK